MVSVALLEIEVSNAPARRAGRAQPGNRPGGVPLEPDGFVDNIGGLNVV